MPGIVYLVGAGPGDPGLITVRGMERLRSADVIVYDRLASPALLHEARSDAELIPCGKEPKQHPMPQEEINRLLIQKALEGKSVCRLKGGDPIVFGRGAEEALALLDAGVPFEIVPGVTSAVAAGAYAGVPVTLRGVASSFAVVTGHEDPTKEQKSVDWQALARAVDTIVILMGVERAGEIARELIAGGRVGSTPVACVSRATTHSQSTLVTTLDRLAEDIAEHGVTAPTVLIVGEVGRLHERLAWFERAPLFGKRILVTRTREQAGELSRLLTECGAEAIEMPVIRIEPPDDWSPFDTALRTLGECDWLVFTSANGVRWALRRLSELGLDVRALAGPRIAAIGTKTRETLSQLGLLVDVVPNEFRGEGLAEALSAEGLAGKRVVLFRAEEGRDVFLEIARSEGAEVTTVPLYRTVPAPELDPDALRLLEEGEIDAVTFASSSSVTNCVHALGEARARALLARTRIACIGPVTARTAEECGLTVAVQPEAPTIEALVEALVHDLAR
jgi:uroporphyrinogen III methyltransferase / synthase